MRAVCSCFVLRHPDVPSDSREDAAAGLHARQTHRGSCVLDPVRLAPFTYCFSGPTTAISLSIPKLELRWLGFAR